MSSSAPTEYQLGGAQEDDFMSKLHEEMDVVLSQLRPGDDDQDVISHEDASEDDRPLSELVPIPAVVAEPPERLGELIHAPVVVKENPERLGALIQVPAVVAEPPAPMEVAVGGAGVPEEGYGAELEGGADDSDERERKRAKWMKYKGPMQCPVCGRSVERAVLKRHQQSKICRAYAF